MTVCRRRVRMPLYAMMSLQYACCWPRDCGPSCRHAAARHARLKRPATLESFWNVYGERWCFSGGCLTGCVLRTCWRVLLTGRHVVFMWHNPRARHLGRQQVRGECALFISDPMHAILKLFHILPPCSRFIRYNNNQYTLYHMTHDCMLIVCQVCK
jgi:hypothetical protein